MLTLITEALELAEAILTLAKDASKDDLPALCAVAVAKADIMTKMCRE